ncbi:putative MFS-type transporter C18.02 [Rhodotorula toruloides]|nr:putative MFS-type transporter C18.02 [Rhodotorula toruloides]
MTSQWLRTRRPTKRGEKGEANDDAASAIPDSKKPPVLLRQRCSTWFIALTVGFGVLVDLSSYSLAVPVIPFRLAAIGHTQDEIGGLTGWLVAAYAGGLIVSSPPVAYIGARWKNRQIPLTLGLLFMAGAVIMFMEANSYALMVVARILQGFSGTVLWTIGLALVTDSVPEERVGKVLGWVMIGFSFGQAIGPPVGGVLYARMGWRAPFVFSLILVAIDLGLRMLIVEKHRAVEWIRRGKEVRGFEAPGWVDEVNTRVEEPKKEREKTIPAGDAEDNARIPVPLADSTPSSTSSDTTLAPSHSRIPSHWIGFLHLLRHPRALTSFLLTLLNGIIAGGLQDTGLTIYLEEEYGLSSFGAGLVFLGIVVPTFFGSPFAGWVTDKYGTKWIMLAGVVLSIAVYPLLIIRGPLPLFIFFLALVGLSISCFITPSTVDLSLVASSHTSITTAHTFAIFNLAFSIGALVGPIIAGQILSGLGVRKGWVALTVLSAGLSAVFVPPVLAFVGGPLRRGSGRKDVQVEEEERGTDRRGEEQEGET